MNDIPEWLTKCNQCKHAYKTKDDAETIYCRCRNGECHPEPYKKGNDKHSNKVKNSQNE